jgi:hypothetical protein
VGSSLSPRPIPLYSYGNAVSRKREADEDERGEHDSLSVLVKSSEICQSRGMPKPTKGPPLEELRRLLSYDPETGKFERLCRSSHAFPGDPVGAWRPDGYLSVSIKNRRYLAHRLAAYYMTGEWPKLEVDHINGDKADNRWSNLRLVDSKTNKENRHRTWKSKWTAKLLGVTRTPKGRWVATITHNYKVNYVGTYDTEEEAHAAYLAAKDRLHSGHLAVANGSVA